MEYMAPEIHDADSELKDIAKSDVWAIGVIAYQICTFTLPFKGSGASAILKAILFDPYKPIEHQGYSAELKDLIDKLLTKNYATRPSMKELLSFPIIFTEIIRLAIESETKQ